MAKESKHQIWELHQMQSLDLRSKVLMTRQRIKGWVAEYGLENVFISFSGGKDSTVLLDIARKMYPGIKAVYVDTGLEYPEIRQFVKSYGDRVVWLRPQINFRHVIEKYGYPFISKEISQCVYEVLKPMSEGKDVTNYAQYKRLCGNYSEKGFMDREKYKFFLDSPFWISHKCCNVMKKKPIHKYEKETGKKPITAQMASESRLRTQKWLQNGCNAFEAKNPISNPMSFWTEQDVLLYIKQNNLELCSVYGDIVEDLTGTEEVEGQLTISDLEGFEDMGLFDAKRLPLKTTGANRTGCMFCGFGAHLEKGLGRYERLAQTHPKICDYVLRGGAFDEDGLWKPDNRGLGFWFVLEWANIHGGFNIGIPNKQYYIDTYGNEMTKKHLTKGVYDGGLNESIH